MTLVDTSVLIDLFNDTATVALARFEQLLLEGEDFAICGVVLTEVLQGIRSDRQHVSVRAALESYLYLPMDRVVFEQAAEIYRGLRRRGITIRKPVDCMIAATAMEHNAWLLHNDRDFEPIARHFGLKVHS